MNPRALAGIAALVGHYDVLFVDQFGVLHDGTAPYPGVRDALARLRDAGQRVVLLSNSGRPGPYNAGRLARLGLGPELYETIVTSGDTALALARSGEIPVRPGMRCLLIDSGGQDTAFCDALGLVVEAEPARADLVLIAGSRGDVVTEAEYRAMLAPLARRGARAVCTNPDRRMLVPGGTAFGAGRIAELYEEEGGTVDWIGKPHPAIYAHAARLCRVRAERVLCIGDSVEHDIAGARGFGADSALVRTGILADAAPAALRAAFVRHGVWPDYVLPGLVW
ncbi:HAD-superfamily subfamily IIA hydrolase like protein [Gluconacetobacter diazotrophicus PA1 5]|uniref:TIGR01459 family HAD-type hydrolase n=2 Tax=Gluconacetobacter diazotrophicus TaxID=33996 RepID=A0A7W4I6G7_GLUDI|nr:TIGR01459 family HAD-type hydrolase [Gluconacetobacter diazotrophicus]ACI51946.1 HAD-superfamily subfamily IIA hydrolase like protein [Gluconacetobacter diazotrophicus PA1 5]MBB2157117.1 TIGR01459 family HAD-type hydrolase [Gluconacetobacter diazotrophicus]TWB05149.1 HAD superfamily hydrolase (TIGR01459 family) [Gluconacetobacter diazotrophicus]CAP55434.1 putative haloacid dehalogenase-like hydrolase [Gluconacetobacter diazotrophicus PA1 5]